MGFVSIIAGLFMAYLWVQHLIYTWAHDLLFLFVAGVLLPPVAVVHGFLIFIGYVQ